MKVCHACNKVVRTDRDIGNDEKCPGCRSDLHVCLNCGFYDAGTFNQCVRERADRVVGKGLKNACPYFEFREESERDLRAAAG